MSIKKTTIWRNVPGKSILVLEKSGLPASFPTIGGENALGLEVYIPEIGNTVCTGYQESGIDKEITEIKLTIRR